MNRAKAKMAKWPLLRKELHELTPESSATANENREAIPLEALLINVMAGHEDLTALHAKSGTSFYYSTLFMSEPYARILSHKQEGAADLIATTVREDSDRYPRPTPLDVF